MSPTGRFPELEASARKVGAAIDRAVAETGEKRRGFVVLIFDFDGPGMAYMSNAQREDVLAAMKEFIAREEGRFVDSDHVS